MDECKQVLPDNVLLQEVNDEIVLLNLDSEFYYSLDAIGSRMLTVLLEAETFAGAVDTLESEYEVSRERLDSDLKDLIQRLKAKGLLAEQVPD